MIVVFAFPQFDYRVRSRTCNVVVSEFACVEEVDMMFSHLMKIVQDKKVCL
jgi:hypothetical protein